MKQFFDRNKVLCRQKLDVFSVQFNCNCVSIADQLELTCICKKQLQLHLPCI